MTGDNLRLLQPSAPDKQGPTDLRFTLGAAGPSHLLVVGVVGVKSPLVQASWGLQRCVIAIGIARCYYIVQFGGRISVVPL